MAIHYFGWALDQLRDGKRVTRPGWNGRGMWLGLQRPTCAYRCTCHEVSSIMTEAYIYMRTAQGGLIPWLASQADMLAGDWELFNILKPVSTAGEQAQEKETQ